MAERVYHVTLAAPFRRVGAAAWAVFNGEYQMPLPDGAGETFEALDGGAIYGALVVTRGTVSAHSNFVFKSYVEAERDVIVWRWVLDDALVPRMTQGKVQNEWGWLVVAPIAETSCRLTLLVHLVPESAFEGRESTLEDVHAHRTRLCIHASARRARDISRWPGSRRHGANQPAVLEGDLCRAREAIGGRFEACDQRRRRRVPAGSARGSRPR
ncbi:Aste57867_23737 [Aphanomyces stellatus]|uniref:Aste57867_23737 protein n=1 Tax=Aphanomyces stellatus TaxID=120398 RepID=A0A485LNT3_9STRA|nr:hypothetical protein As57867_023665 [Aphanomyces stellatus]VFU00382.1 Aste57867_23737 [Aphanomyces stellatus]